MVRVKVSISGPYQRESERGQWDTIDPQKVMFVPRGSKFSNTRGLINPRFARVYTSAPSR